MKNNLDSKKIGLADHIVYNNTASYMTIPYIVPFENISSIRNDYTSVMTVQGRQFWIDFFKTRSNRFIVVCNDYTKFKSDNNIKYLDLNKFCNGSNNISDINKILEYVLFRYTFDHLCICNNAISYDDIVRCMNDNHIYTDKLKYGILISRNTCICVVCNEEKDYVGVKNLAIDYYIV